MLSVDECRALIDDGDTMSDEEIEALRKDMYELVQLMFDVWWEKKKPQP